MPAAFARAGWGLSTVSLVFLAFMSFMNATYVIEAMACANAVFKWRRLQSIKRDESVSILHFGKQHKIFKNLKKGFPVQKRPL